jgi:hypothetical protein
MYPMKDHAKALERAVLALITVLITVGALVSLMVYFSRLER